uniref:Non-structural maintenance of chromosomes element 1 homolog n=1 Tax=Leersia perrieri TaxID=77586 RepID=A0A0D9XWI4_9ORYZ
MAPLSWRHHTLLQALLSRGPQSERDFHALFAAISGGKNPATNQQLFNDVLLKINKELSYLQFELRACMNQYDGTVYYGVVNNIADEESKLGSKYSVPQIAFYKGLLEAIVHEAGNDGSITNIDALNTRIESQVVIADSSQDTQSRLPTSITNFSLSQKEKTLNELIQDRWLSYTPTGKIGLGIRSFLDLRSWFRSNDIPSCEVCNEVGIKATTCPNEGCNVRIHDYCLKKKFSQRKASRACHGCGAEWPLLEGEDDGTEDVNEPEEDQVPSANHHSRTRRRGIKSELLEENERTGSSTRTTRRSLRSAKAEAVEIAQVAASAGPSQSTRASKRRKN